MRVEAQICVKWPGVARLVTLLALAASVAFVQPSPAAASTITSRIAGGYYPAADAWPWVTALVDRSRGGSTDFQNFGCTATLIAPRRVLTAAHCVAASGTVAPKPATNFQALVGRRTLTNQSEGVRRNVTSIVIHPRASLPSTGAHRYHAFYDLAVMFLDAPVPISPAPVGVETDFATQGTVMGWGHINYDHNNQIRGEYLKAADLQILTDAQCHAAIDRNGVQHYFPTIHLCALDPERVDCVTHGDSGGPLMVYKNGAWRLVGVTSFYPTDDSCGPIGFAWVAGPTLRSWALTVPEPAAARVNPGSGPDLAMSAAQVRRYIRAMIRDNTNGKVRRLRRSCRRLSSRSFRCRLSWRIKRRAYAGTARFSHYARGGTVYWSYVFKGKRHKLGCSRRCTKRLRW